MASMQRNTPRGRTATLAGLIGLLAVTGSLSAHERPHSQAQAQTPQTPQAPQGPGEQAGTQSARTDSVLATGCLLDVRELGGQGAGGARWQGSVSGHVLTDIRMPSSPHAIAAPSALLIRGLSDTELRRFRGQQVEVRGLVSPSQETSQAAAVPRGSGTEDSAASPNGRVAGERRTPAVGTGGTLRVPASPRRGAAGNQRPPEFQATSIRSIARTCPAAAR